LLDSQGTQDIDDDPNAPRIKRRHHPWSGGNILILQSQGDRQSDLDALGSDGLEHGIACSRAGAQGRYESAGVKNCIHLARTINETGKPTTKLFAPVLVDNIVR
jgi:hypothetical protein